MALDTPVFSVTLHRWQAGQELTGHYLGYAYHRNVAVKGSLTLSANNKEHLSLMVAMASQDGWRRKL